MTRESVSPAVNKSGTWGFLKSTFAAPDSAPRETVLDSGMV